MTYHDIGSNGVAMTHFDSMVKPRTSVGGSAKTEAPAADAPIAAKSTGKTFTWQEIAQHNDAKSAWVYRGTRVYDITSWIDKHPGGRDMILLAAGRDCTDLFESYHPFSDRAHKIVESYYIGELAGQPEIAQYKQDSGFFRDLKTAVSAHFAKTGQNPRDPTPGLVRLVFILAFAWLGFMGANTLSLPFSARVFFAVLFGICQALPLLHVMHDCSHASLSDNPKMWTFFGYFCMDYFAGASLNSWYHQHIVGHHIFTNVNGVDPDVPASKEGDIRRISSFQTWVPMYKFQHLYLPFLYGFLAFKFRIQDITDTLIKRANGVTRVNPFGGNSYIEQAVSKTFWFLWRIAMPLLLWRIPVGEYFLLFVISEMSTGWWLTFNFQVSHVSPQLAFPNLPEDGSKKLAEEWAVQQVMGTIDYAHGNWIATFLCGALNYQTVHHLFPGVSQYHYPAIAPIVQRVCKQHKIKYNLLPGGFWQAFGLHYQHLVTMGFPDSH